MDEAVRLLQIGGTSLKERYPIPAGVEIIHLDKFGVGEFLAQNRSMRLGAALLMELPNREDVPILSEVLLPYTVFFTCKDEENGSDVAELLKMKQARYLPEKGIARFLRMLPLRFWYGQYGDKLSVNDIDVADTFAGDIRFEGHVRLTLSGFFGEGEKQILSWRGHRVLEKERALELWPEVETGKDVRAALCVSLYKSASPDVLIRRWYFDLADRKPVVLLPSERGYLTFSLHAKGEGTLRIGMLHVRQSRVGAGCLLAGGERFADEAGDEFFSYFDPGDLKPPLCVYFSGYRTAEGFEGFHLMKQLHAPFLLFADPRLEGGAYYMGSRAFEDALEERIRAALRFLSFDHTQLVLSGLSMGTSGACYYASRLLPRDVIAGKLLLNAGDIAVNVSKVRPDDFATSLDMLYALGGGNGPDAVKAANEKMWNALRKADFSGTRFAIVYMRHDDYDKNAYEELIRHLGEKGVRIYGKGIDGRHNDDTPAVTGWFIRQYMRILEQDFQRSFC